MQGAQVSSMLDVVWMRKVGCMQESFVQGHCSHFVVGSRSRQMSGLNGSIDWRNDRNKRLAWVRINYLKADCFTINSMWGMWIEQKQSGINSRFPLETKPQGIHLSLRRFWQLGYLISAECEGRVLLLLLKKIMIITSGHWPVTQTANTLIQVRRKSFFPYSQWRWLLMLVWRASCPISPKFGV